MSRCRCCSLTEEGVLLSLYIHCTSTPVCMQRVCLYVCVCVSVLPLNCLLISPYVFLGLEELVRPPHPPPPTPSLHDDSWLGWIGWVGERKREGGGAGGHDYMEWLLTKAEYWEYFLLESLISVFFEEVAIKTEQHAAEITRPHCPKRVAAFFKS